MSRGRPSRPPAPHTSEHDLADVTSIAWDVSVPDGEVRLNRDRLAILLAGESNDPVCPVTATSRAPGSRLNGVAARLSPAFTAWLTLQARTDDRGRCIVGVELTATSRRARRAVDRVRLDDSWTRTRGSTSTTLRSTLLPSGTRRTTAVRVCDRVGALLDRLGWPLVDWTFTAEGP